MSNKITIEQIDAILPQTQCGLCNYGGCKPYAQAILEQQETITHCPPGGEKVLRQLADLLGQEITQAMLDDVQQKQKPPMLANIREHECIGCTKCIQVCPTDAIVGTAKRMHTVIKSECTGCELCVPVCPMDCIDMIEISVLTQQQQYEKSNYWRQRYQARQARLEKQIDNRHLTDKKQQLNQQQFTDKNLISKRAEIAAAIARVKAKKAK